MSRQNADLWYFSRFFQFDAMRHIITMVGMLALITMSFDRGHH